jgi:hypothetical protein
MLHPKILTLQHDLAIYQRSIPCLHLHLTAVKTVLSASLIACALAFLLTHTHHMQTCPQQADAPRPQTPLHPTLLAIQLAVSGHSIAQPFDLERAEAKRHWDKIAELLTHAGKDPNWRRRPPVSNLI